MYQIMGMFVFLKIIRKNRFILINMVIRQFAFKKTERYTHIEYTD